MRANGSIGRLYQPQVKRPRARSSFLVLSLVGAVALCGLGLWSLTDNYDGITSLINVVTIGSCCAAALLLVMALPIAWFTHEVLNDRATRD